MIINRITFTRECYCTVSFSKLENHLSHHGNILNIELQNYILNSSLYILRKFSV